MLKDDPRYEYVEVDSDPQPAVAHMYSRPILIRGRVVSQITLPVGPGFQRVPQFASAPLQSYLAERFAHIGGRSHHFRALRLENQRKHDYCASLGHWPMSRTS